MTDVAHEQRIADLHRDRRGYRRAARAADEIGDSAIAKIMNAAARLKGIAIIRLIKGHLKSAR